MWPQPLWALGTQGPRIGAHKESHGHTRALEVPFFDRKKGRKGPEGLELAHMGSAPRKALFFCKTWPGPLLGTQGHKELRCFAAKRAGTREHSSVHFSIPAIFQIADGGFRAGTHWWVFRAGAHKERSCFVAAWPGPHRFGTHEHSRVHVLIHTSKCRV